MIGVSIAVPIINDKTAADVEKRIKALPLPENTTYCESFSKAGKLSGNGNGMQYLGGILIQSDLSLEELRTFYGEDITVREQMEQRLTVMEHVHYLLETEIKGNDYFIVFEYGDGNAFCQEFDLRGH